MSTSADHAYKQHWDNRYKENAYAYGKAPNEFFKSQLDLLTPGTILLPADGEARNGVYAAKTGWQVTSLDLSEEGKHKALALAAEENVSLNYLVGDLEAFTFEAASFDVIALIYAHFTADKKSALHKKLSGWLKPGGTIIFEAFSKSNLRLAQANPAIGGPKEEAMLFSTEEVAHDFAGYHISLLEEQEVPLAEGGYHNGIGAVIRFIGTKPL